MGIGKADFFADHDVFIEYDFEDVMFRWDVARKTIYRRFRHRHTESEVSHDNRLFNDSVLFGDVITKERYFSGMVSCLIQHRLGSYE